MKKLLILLSLTTTMTAFGVTSNDQATMNIKATVIKPLTIIAKNMEFGTVIQGTKATATGQYTIDGEPGEKFEVTLSNLSSLKRNGSEDTLDISFNNFVIPHNLDNAGKASFDMVGTINPTTETVTGIYTGSITARVQYQ
ncbi:hypothetical protein MKD34_01795 [Cetobacterium somerae]|uniref:DUF4402 domain-containing protein n=1 Tax=Bacteria TaxID=2 RepID=UPI001F061597|nr:DUF4402 domain-containing protein [Cetobacterium somerae]UPO97599.1 hypothetical protein MKD34_01795 [Cetobacterium somerae]